MINIAKKRMPSALLAVIVYISYCAAGWYSMRGSLAYYGEQYSMPAGFANDVLAFFAAGLLPFAIFAVASTFIFRTLTVKIRGDVSAIRYGLGLSIIAANVVIFALNFIYLAAPLAVGVMKTLLAPLVSIAFVSLYLFYAFYQDYVDKSTFRVIVAQVLGTMITVYAIVAVVGIIGTVV